jgi:hypothetical protein
VKCQDLCQVPSPCWTFLGLALRQRCLGIRAHGVWRLGMLSLTTCHAAHSSWKPLLPSQATAWVWCFPAMMCGSALEVDTVAGLVHTALEQHVQFSSDAQWETARGGI